MRATKGKRARPRKERQEKKCGTGSRDRKENRLENAVARLENAVEGAGRESRRSGGTRRKETEAGGREDGRERAGGTTRRKVVKDKAEHENSEPNRTK